MPTPLTLKVYRGDELVRTEQFTRDIIKIGRLSSAHLCLEDDKISRIHSVIEVAPDGGISIIDMGSAVGTYVNGKRVSRGPLRTGDQITLGNLKIVLDEVATAEAVNAAAGFNRAVEVPATQDGSARHATAFHDTATGAEAPAPVPEPVRAPSPVREPDRQEATAAAPARAPAPARSKPAGREAAPPSPVKRLPRPKGQARAAERQETEDESPAAELGVELRMLWGATLLDAGTFVKPTSPVLVGETAKCHFHLSGPDLPVPAFPILRFEEGEYRFLFARGMTGAVEDAGEAFSLSQLVKEKKAAPDGAIDGAYSIAVPHEGAVRAEFGSGISIEARFKRPPKPAVVPWWERINYQFLNLFLVLLFIQGGFIVAAQNFPYDTDTVADDLYKNPSRMAKFIIKPAVEQPKLVNKYADLDKGLKKDDPGEMAEKHKGQEGQMGKKDAPRTTGRSAPKAIDPNAKDIVKNSGLVALLGRGRGGGGLSTVFGQGGLGGDLKGAVGNMFGPVVGDSYGLGGLGLKGTGTGGGGAGETIGIGGVGTKGRGGGLGGYGSGVGGLGRKSDRDVSISSGTATVMGSVDKELIRKVIQDHAAQIRYCYEQELALNPKLEGKVSIRWIINGDGHASNPQIDSGATTLADGKVHECMMSRITSWEFPKPKGGGIAVITYPWILRASGGGGG